MPPRLVDLTITGSQLARPYHCRCGSAKDLLDTDIMDSEGVLYVCKSCARLWARTWGFAPGKRMDELNTASELLSLKEAEVGGLVVALEDEKIAKQTERAYVRELKTEIEQLEGKLTTAVNLGRQIAEAAAALQEQQPAYPPLQIA